MSDYEAEERINDSLTFSHFFDLSLQKTFPDHIQSVVFEMKWSKKFFDKLFKAFNKQLEKHKIILKKGVLVNASVTKSPFLPHQKTDFEIVPVDRAEISTEETEEDVEGKSGDIASKKNRK